MNVSMRIAAMLFALAALNGCGGGSAGSGTQTGQTPSSSPAPVTPAISSFAAAPGATNAGRAVTLSWTVRNADKLTLMPGSIDVTGVSSYTLTPSATTTYTLLATSSASQAAVQSNATARIYDWSSVASTLDGALTGTGNPNSTLTGFSFQLFDRYGSLFSHSGGDQTMDSVEPLASSSKLPSAVAILTLVDSGQLNLDQPVATYLAKSPVQWPSDKAAITTRMLLNHTSGLPGSNDTQPACISNYQGMKLATCVQQIANTSLLYPPGADFNYGGADYQVAGYIATLLSGETWQDFFTSAIGAPLGLSTYTYGNPAYVTNPRIAGGASSDAEEYAKILQMIQNGGLYGGIPVLSMTAISELQINQIAGLPVAYSPLNASVYPGYAFGLFFSAPALYLNSPGPEYSDVGSYGTAPWIDNGLGYGAVLLINNQTVVGIDLWNLLRPKIIAQLSGS